MNKIPLFILAAITLGSCKKNGDNSPAPPTISDQLTAHPWQLTAYTIDDAYNSRPNIVDVYASAQPCYLDNTITFRPGG